MTKRGRAIVVLSGAIKKDKQKGWYSPGFKEGYVFGITGSHLRIDAAGYLYQEDPHVLFIASGGYGQTKNAPPMAEIMAEELVGVGIPKNKIILESKSANTFEQLKELVSLIKINYFQDIAIISNKYHIARIKTLIKYMPALKKLRALKHLRVVSAESIVLKHHQQKWRGMIEKAYASPAMKKRIKLERKGIEDLKNGNYKFNQ